MNETVTQRNDPKPNADDTEHGNMSYSDTREDTTHPNIEKPKTIVR